MPHIGNIPISKRGIVFLDERLGNVGHVQMDTALFQKAWCNFSNVLLGFGYCPAKTDRVAEGYFYQKGMLQVVLNVALVATYRTQN